MLRAYLECECLPGLLRISQEKQFENVSYGSKQPGFRLLKQVWPVDFLTDRNDCANSYM